MSLLKPTLTFLFVGVIGFFLLRLVARWMIYPRPAVRFPSESELTRRFPNARLIPYETSDRVALKGVAVKAGAPADAVVLYFHGNAEAAAQNLPLAEDLAREGFEVLLAEYRGYSGLAGRPTEAGLCRDGEAALDAFVGRRAPPLPVVLVGRSLGTGVAIELASRRPPRLLILVSPYTSLVDMGRSLVGPLSPALVPDRFDNLSKIAALTCPVVILHGTRDEVVPLDMGRRLAAAGKNVRFLPLEGRSHNDLPELALLLIAEIRRELAATR